MSRQFTNGPKVFLKYVIRFQLEAKYRYHAATDMNCTSNLNMTIPLELLIFLNVTNFSVFLHVPLINEVRTRTEDES